MSAVAGMWRYFDRLPVRFPTNIVTLGEGLTPLIDLSATLGAHLGLERLWLKAEDRNPTGSFKARVASVAYSLIKERALAGAVGTSSGNGAAAAAAYAAASGSRAILFTLSDTVPAKMREIIAVGGTAHRVRGVGHDARSTLMVAGHIAEQAKRLGFYPMLTAFTFAREAMAGVKTIAYELAEQAPDATRVYVPVGGGGLITGVHRGYQDLDGSEPKLVGVHPAGAGALARALDGHPEGIEGPVTSEISGLQMAVLYDPTGAVDAVRGSDGHSTAVDDAGVYAAQRLLAQRAGLLVEPAGATALAGVIADLSTGRLDQSEPVVVVATGAGYKDSAAVERLAPLTNVEVIGANDVGLLLSALAEAGTEVLHPCRTTDHDGPADPERVSHPR